MAIVSTNVPLFAGVEDIDDMFIATMEEMDKEISDDLVIAHPLYEYCHRNNLIEFRDQIATHIPVRRREHRNGTVKWHTGYDDRNLEPQRLLAEVRFPYGQISATQMYNREELIKNQGGQLIDLVEEKANGTYADLYEDFADAVIGTQDADGRKPLGIGRIMDETASVAGLAPGDDPTWKPTRIYKTGSTNYTLSTEFREGMRKMTRTMAVSAGGRTLGKNTAGRPVSARRVLVCGEDLYESHQAWAESKLQMRMGEIKDSSGWGDFEMFDFNGKTIIYEPALAAKEGWLLNMDMGVRIRIHSGTNFLWTPWDIIDNKIQVKARDLLCYVSVYTRSRKANARIVFS